MHTHAFMLSCLTTATFAGLLCSSAPCHAQDPDREGRGQVERGFVLRASLGGRASLINSFGSSTFLGLGSNGTLQVGAFAGGKIGRIMIGVGLDFSNFTIPNSASTTSLTSLIVAPEVMGVVARTADQRVEMLLDAALGLGGLFNSSSNSSNTLELSYQLGPGARYWTHPHFAIQGLTGFSGHVYFPSGSSIANPASLHGVFAALSVLGVL